VRVQTFWPLVSKLIIPLFLLSPYRLHRRNEPPPPPPDAQLQARPARAARPGAPAGAPSGPAPKGRSEQAGGPRRVLCVVCVSLSSAETKEKRRARLGATYVSRQEGGCKCYVCASRKRVRGKRVRVRKWGVKKGCRCVRSPSPRGALVCARRRRRRRHPRCFVVLTHPCHLTGNSCVSGPTVPNRSSDASRSRSSA